MQGRINEKLFYVLYDEYDEFELLPIICEEESPERISIGSNVTRVITKENGNIVVGYLCEIGEDIIREYSPDGELISSVKNKLSSRPFIVQMQRENIEQNVVYYNQIGRCINYDNN